MTNLDVTKYKNKEILVRKVLVNFVEKIFNHLGYKLNHDRVKKVLYKEDAFNSLDEEKIKRAYDAYIYLLSNAKNPLTNQILNTFFYIYFGREIDENVALRIATKHFNYIDKPVIESAVDFHIDVFNEIDCADDKDKLAISLMFFNYVIVKHDIPSTCFNLSDLEDYGRLKNDYLNDNRVALYELFFKIVDNEKIQDKSYYKYLRQLTLKDIYQVLKEDEEYIKTNFEIKHLSIFGSFAKEINRIDSDIDLLASFSLDLTTNEKREKIGLFKHRYFTKFNCFIDVSEVSEYLDDEFIKKVPYVKKIF